MAKMKDHGADLAELEVLVHAKFGHEFLARLQGVALSRNMSDRACAELLASADAWHAVEEAAREGWTAAERLQKAEEFEHDLWLDRLDTDAHNDEIADLKKLHGKDWRKFF